MKFFFNEQVLGWFYIALFFFCMWMITLFMLVRGKFSAPKGKNKNRKMKDWVGLLIAYSSLVFIGIGGLIWR